jgi:hypothetical protein
MDGSVVLSKEEATRPENDGLSALVGRIAAAKKVIDEGNAKIGSGPISWADTIMLAAKVAVEQEWRDIKLKKAANPDAGEQIVRAFGAQWDVRLGRIDSPVAVSSRALAPGAGTEEMRDFMMRLGAKPGAGSGPLVPKPPFWERPAFVIYPATQDDPAVRAGTMFALPSCLGAVVCACSGCWDAHLRAVREFGFVISVARMRQSHLCRIRATEMCLPILWIDMCEWLGLILLHWSSQDPCAFGSVRPQPSGLHGSIGMSKKTAPNLWITDIQVDGFAMLDCTWTLIPLERPGFWPEVRHPPKVPHVCRRTRPRSLPRMTRLRRSSRSLTLSARQQRAPTTRLTSSIISTS